jgi:hypothetical protein
MERPTPGGPGSLSIRHQRLRVLVAAEGEVVAVASGANPSACFPFDFFPIPEESESETGVRNTILMRCCPTSKAKQRGHGHRPTMCMAIFISSRTTYPSRSRCRPTSNLSTSYPVAVHLGGHAENVADADFDGLSPGPKRALSQTFTELPTVHMMTTRPTTRQRGD